MFDYDCFIFDTGNPSWVWSKEWNCIFIEKTMDRLGVTLRSKGYVYLNEIYEAFGVKWDPQRDNLIYIRIKGKKREFMGYHEIGDSNTWEIKTYFLKKKAHGLRKLRLLLSEEVK